MIQPRKSDKKPDIRNISRNELIAFFAGHGMRSFRADQALQWL
ncbi:MAG: hypothetical protein ACOC1H_03260, partial [Desulfosalsimonas sp.]